MSETEESIVLDQQAKNQIDDDEEIDIDEVDDRLAQLTNDLDTLTKYKSNLPQFKLSLQEFIESRTKILVLIKGYKQRCFEDRKLFDNLTQKETETREIELKARNISQEVEWANSQSKLTAYFNSQIQTQEFKVGLARGKVSSSTEQWVTDLKENSRTNAQEQKDNDVSVEDLGINFNPPLDKSQNISDATLVVNSNDIYKDQLNFVAKLKAQNDGIQQSMNTTNGGNETMTNILQTMGNDRTASSPNNFDMKKMDNQIQELQDIAHAISKGRDSQQLKSPADLQQTDLARSKRITDMNRALEQVDKDAAMYEQKKREEQTMAAQAQTLNQLQTSTKKTSAIATENMVPEKKSCANCAIF